MLRRLISPVVPGNTRDAGSCHDLFGSTFVSHGLYGLPWWANEDQTSFGAFPSKLGILAKEPIARMDAIAAMVFGCLNYPVPIQVRSGAAEVDGEWRAKCMLGLSIRIRIQNRRAISTSRCCPAYTSGQLLTEEPSELEEVLTEQSRRGLLSISTIESCERSLSEEWND